MREELDLMVQMIEEHAEELTDAVEGNDDAGRSLGRIFDLARLARARLRSAAVA